MPHRLTVWIPTDGIHGWEVEGTRPHVARWVGGGIRSMHELAVAIASTGRQVELRGAVHLPTLDELAEAAGVRPDLPDQPRRLEEGDVVIVPEGIDDPAIHARLALSPAHAILMMLGPPGLVGWPFVAGWSRPDPLTVDIGAVARPEHFRGARALGYELWTLSPALGAAARDSGVECRVVGTGWPAGIPDPVEKDVDVVTMRDNRWAPLAAPVVRRLRDRGVECLEVPAAGHARTLAALARARILLLPARIEGQSRLGCEARSVGTVPVVLDTNPYGVGLDESGGAIALHSTAAMPEAIRELLADRTRLRWLEENARASAREQVAWAPYVARVAEALDQLQPNAGRGARAGLGAALERQDEGRLRRRQNGTAGRPDSQQPADVVARLERAHAIAGEALADAHDELARHKLWLEAVNGSLSWRVTAPLRGETVTKLSARVGSRIRGRRVEPDEPIQAHHRRPRSLERPAGHLDEPDAASPSPRAPVRVFGWALFPGTSVERVEIVADSIMPRRARLGVERDDVAEVIAHPDAPVSGFELMLDLAELPPERDSVTLRAVAYAADGRRLSLGPLRLAVDAADGPDSDHLASLPPRPADQFRGPPSMRRPNRPLRVVAFSHELSYSGASLYLSELLTRLSQAGRFEFSVVSFEDGPLRDRLTAAGIPVHLTSMPPLGSAASYEHRQAELRAWLAPQRFDLALVNTLSAFPGANTVLDLGLPTVWSIHESFEFPQFLAAAFPPGLPHPHVRARFEHALSGAACLVFPARATEVLFTEYADAERLMTVPYGIELPDIDAARRLSAPSELRRELGIADDARVLLCLGSIEPRKCQAMLTQAFARVAASHPTAQLLLVGRIEGGRRGAYARAIEAHLTRSGLKPRVRLEPVSDDPHAFQCLADVAVCASDLESLPRSVVEAMAFEKPVLSTTVYGIPELIEDGVNGFLCDTSDVGALAAGLDRVLGADPDMLRSVARAGSDRVRARHDPERQAAAFADVLEGAATGAQATLVGG